MWILCGSGLALSVGLSACQGVFDSAAGEEGYRPGQAPTPTEPVRASEDFTCDTGVPPVAPPLRRLSRVQYSNTVSSVLDELVGGGARAEVMGAVDGRLAAYPRDTLGAHPEEGQRLFARSDQSLSADLVGAHLRVAEAVAQELTRDDSRLGATVGPCATDFDGANDAACLDAFVERLGELTHRRPITDAERTFYRNEAYIDGNQVTAVGVSELITVMLSQPSFVFHMEGQPELTAYEAASRISYHFWNTMPDAELMAAAADGSLLTEEGWAAQVHRAVSDPRAESALVEMLSEWFKHDRTAPLSSGSGATFDALRGSLAIDTSLDRAAEAELTDLFLHTVRTGGTFRDFFLSDVSLARHESLGELYGVSLASDGPTSLPPERRGILTRAGLLLARSDVSAPGPGARTHPILRGVFVQRQILCNVIPPPPPGAVDTAPVDDAMQSSRESAVARTETGPCAGCHTVLNQPGYALEEFDSLGRWRAEERLFSDTGSEVGSVDVDATVDIEGTTVTGGSELSAALYESELPSACFTRHYARFALGRAEDVVTDGCMLRHVDELIDADAPLSEVLAAPLLLQRPGASQ